MFLSRTLPSRTARQLARYRAPGWSGFGAGKRSMSSLVSMEEEFPGDYSPTSTASSTPPSSSIEKSTLANGVSVISTSGVGNAICSVSTTLSSGSIYESSVSEYGASAVLGKAGFKATKSRSSLKMLRDIEVVGGSPSVTVSRESISYGVSALSQYSDIAILASLETAFTPKLVDYHIMDLKAEVEKENNTFSTSGETLAQEACFEAAFGEDTPLGHSMYSSTANLTYDAVRNFHATKALVGSGITVVGSGVDHATLVDMATSMTSDVVSGNISTPSSTYIGGEARIKATSPLTYMCIALPAKASAVTDVLVSLWNMKLPEGCTAFYSSGLIGVKGSAAPSNVGATVDLALQIMKGSHAESIKEGIMKAKVANLTLADSDVASFLTKGGVLASVDSVTSGDVKSAVDAIWAQKPTIASVGDVSKVPKLASL